MASHFQPIPGARPHISPRNMAIAMRDDETRRAIEARLAGRPRHKTVRQPLLERIAEALDSPRMLVFYAGFYSGAMATVALALIWSAVLS